jgi:glycerol-3-phosphate dehydrogenase
MEVYDVCIVGIGGVVGQAIARELALKHRSVAGLEKHSSAAQETSGRNSRVIHSGFHEIPGTLKAHLAREGSKLIVEYAKARQVKLLNTGMLIAVPFGALRDGLWKEGLALWNVWRGGSAQDIPFKFILSSAGVRQIAPIRALGGIFIPSVCVIDLEHLMASLEEDSKAAGAQFFYGNEVVNIEVAGSTYVVSTPSTQIRAPILINSAGLYAPEISGMAGGPQYAVEFLRGDYYEILGGVDAWNIRTLVYPATPRRSPSKGVHFGPRTDGRLFIGPNAFPAQDRSAPDLDRTPKEVFLRAARKFLPELTGYDLRWAYGGIRPKCAGLDGRSDFIIRVDKTNPLLLNLIGIDSPGLSASLAIARHVARLVGVSRESRE